MIISGSGKSFGADFYNSLINTGKNIMEKFVYLYTVLSLLCVDNVICMNDERRLRPSVPQVEFPAQAPFEINDYRLKPVVWNSLAKQIRRVNSEFRYSKIV
ncbi:MAG: hypothetical protein LBF54_03740 [Holosporaceae bacterium]|nr:hypothetical protein [Holosporaceae bacterium]